MRLPTRKPSAASRLSRGLFLAVVALASACLNPRPEDDPSSTDGSSAVNPNDAPASAGAPPGDDSDLSPQPPSGGGAANDPNAGAPSGVEGGTPTSGNPDPFPLDAGVPPDGGSDAGP